jgi:hypothetical protein
VVNLDYFAGGFLTAEFINLSGVQAQMDTRGRFDCVFSGARVKFQPKFGVSYADSD